MRREGGGAATSAVGRRRGWAINELALFALLAATSVRGQLSPWEDVCTAERYALYEAELCPKVFFTSTIEYNPNYPNLESNVTVILMPSQSMPRDVSYTQYVSIELPGFDWLGTDDAYNANIRYLPITQKDPTGYEILTDLTFYPQAQYLKTTGQLRLTVQYAVKLVAAEATEITICCVLLPSSAVKDDPVYQISALTVESPLAPQGLASESIAFGPILSTPFIDPGYQWEFLQVQFNPPTSKATTTISLILSSANDLGERCRIILKLPTVTRVINASGEVGFNTASSGDSSDWMLFDHIAFWDNDQQSLRFSLREGVVFTKHRFVTLTTDPGEFRLPVEVPANWINIQVEARSSDNIDEIIKATPVMQSSRVPHVQYFKYSELRYVPKDGGKMDVELIFRTNRAMYAGSSIYLRLAGFRAEVIEVPLTGHLKKHFLGELARFHLPQNTLELNVNETLYSNEQYVVIGFTDLYLPPALYKDDGSLLIWNSDPAAEKQSIQISPMVGGGVKTFVQSQVKFSPAERRMPANITFILLPSSIFYEQDHLVFHLYGFTCPSSTVPLIGPGASQIENSVGHWNAAESTLVMTVATNKVIGILSPLMVEIGLETNCRLPDKLSQNDGVLRIEGKAAFKGDLIVKEPMKKVPMLGDPKFVIHSDVEFSDAQDKPAQPNSIARIRFSIILNCDVLPNSTINITLGGLVRDPPGMPAGVNAALRSGEIRLSGVNAPLFFNKADWSQDEVKLSLKMVSTVAILSGEEVRFFVEVDEYFRLPYVVYPNDPSFKLSILEAGIPDRPFHQTSRVSQTTKSFSISDLYYGGDKFSVAYPNSVTEVTLKFKANVNLPGGSIIRITLPGFTLPASSVTLASAISGTEQVGESYLNQDIPTGAWDQNAYTIELEVPFGVILDITQKWVMRVMEVGGFRLPSEPMDLNDPRLTIACIRNQIIYEEPIKDSPRVVDRSFMVSEFEYRPPQKESIFLLIIDLKPTVNITEDNEITIKLPGFRNSLSKVNIHIMGPDRHRITESMAQWNETMQVLTLTVPKDQPIDAFTHLQLQIEESQGFILPQALNANDTRILIASKDNIIAEPIKKSPMVGNGPFANHQFCAYQYERGVRSGDPICTAAIDCSPPLRDPCSSVELARCGCEPRLDTVFPLTVQGFNLQENDLIMFVPQAELCSRNGNDGPSIQSSFAPVTHTVLSSSQARLEFHGVSATETGYYRICVEHVGLMFDIGTIVVRPSCQRPFVLVDGTCVEHCPKTKIPIAGNCVRDPYAIEAEDRQAMMIAVRMHEPAAGGNIADRPSDDAELLYFIYRYTYELARLLDADPERIQVSSVSNGSVLVNTVFTTVGGEEAIQVGTERSPRALVSLLQALQTDTSSQLHESAFFKHIDRDYLPPPIPVRQCPDGTYRVFCPYEGVILSAGEVLAYLCVGVVLVPLVLMCCCGCAWAIDFETASPISDEVLEKVREDYKQVDVPLQIEYAKSWLEGRFMGEDWQKARDAKFLPVEN